jgi:hypothetical protein
MCRPRRKSQAKPPRRPVATLPTTFSPRRISARTAWTKCGADVGSSPGLRTVDPSSPVPQEGTHERGTDQRRAYLAGLQASDPLASTGMISRHIDPRCAPSPPTTTGRGSCRSPSSARTAQGRPGRVDQDADLDHVRAWAGTVDDRPSARSIRCAGPDAAGSVHFGIQRLPTRRPVPQAAPQHR